MKILHWFNKLLQNNSGLSAKSFFLVTVTIIGCILLLVPAFILIMEVCYNHTITTDLSGLAEYIGAVAAIFATAGVTKAWAEKFEQKKKIDEKPADDGESAE